MPRTIQDAKPIIEGREVWVCGSGPSLDLVSWDGDTEAKHLVCPPDATVIAINATAEVIGARAGSRPLALIAMDAQEIRRRKNWPVASHLFLSLQAWDCAVGFMGWTRDRAEEAYVFDQELERAPGTVTAACDLAGKLKAKRIVLAGIGGDGFAACAAASERYAKPPAPYEQFLYEQQHAGALAVLWKHRLTYRHVSEAKWMVPNG